MKPKNKLLKWIVKHLPTGKKEEIPVTSEELLIAVSIGDEQTLRKLLDAGVDPNLTDHMGRIPLHQAVENCLPSLIKWLVFKGGDINIRNEKEENALMVALERNDLESARELLRLGIALDAYNLNRKTIYDLAKERNHTSFLELLDYFQKTRSSSKQQKFKLQAQMFAAKRVTKDEPPKDKQLSAAMKKAMDKVARDKEARTKKAKAAYEARIKKARKIAYKNRKEVHPVKEIPSTQKQRRVRIKEKLQKIAEALCCENTVETMLIQAIRQHKNEHLKTLLACDGSCERVDANSLMTPLAAGVIYQNETAVSILLEKGAQPNGLYKGHTLLFYALRLENYGIVQALLKAGARPDNTTDTPTPLCLAIIKNNQELVELLLDNGADASFSSKEETPLKTAIVHGKTVFIDALVNACANLECRATGRSPLSWAMLYKDMNAFKLLLKHGADIDGGRGEGDTVLSQALRSDKLDFLDLILNEQPDVNILDKYGRTPLIEAVLADRLEVVKKLLKAGAEVAMEDLDGKTAISIAVKLRGREKILHLLRSWKGS